MTEIADQIASFIRTRFQVPDRDTRFHYDVHLWDEGFIDSMGVVELLAFLENHFNVELPPETFFNEDCTTINGLARLISSLPTASEVPKTGREHPSLLASGN